MSVCVCACCKGQMVCFAHTPSCHFWVQWRIQEENEKRARRKKTVCAVAKKKKPIFGERRRTTIAVEAAAAAQQQTLRCYKTSDQIKIKDGQVATPNLLNSKIKCCENAVRKRNTPETQSIFRFAFSEFSLFLCSAAVAFNNEQSITCNDRNATIRCVWRKVK